MISQTLNPNEVLQSCEEVRASFQGYLDGAVSGVQMAFLADHLETCAACAEDFIAWRSMQVALGELRPVQAPADLQRQLRAAASLEVSRGTHLSPVRRLAAAWQSSIAPIAFRFAGGLAAAIIVASGVAFVFGAPLPVQANDDRMAHLVGPHYLYSQVPPQPIENGRDVPILVQAKIDERGRAYDYTILEGPQDAAVRLRVEQNLLASVFKPATVFGVPVRGEVMLTYTSVSVRG